MVKNKVIQCLKGGENSSDMVEEIEFKHDEKIGKTLKSFKTAYERKMTLFNWLKELVVEELQSQVNQRANSLLLSKLYAELAKEKMKEYKKTTVDVFNEEKEEK